MTETPKRLIAGSKVQGTAVYNLKHERLGHIDELMIEKATGRVSYAVLVFGGFLGINGRHYPLPWGALRYEPGVDGYVVDVSRDALEDAPAYVAGTTPDWTEQSWSHIDSYYRDRASD